MYLMALFILPTNAGLHASGRETLFDKNWKFYLGSIANAEQPIFNDSMWRILDLPHDWRTFISPKRKYHHWSFLTYE